MEFGEEMLRLKTRKKIKVLKTGEKIKVLNGLYMETEVKDNLLVLPGRVKERTVNVLKDVGWSGVIVRS